MRISTQSYDPARPLILVHLVKTAGKSLTSALSAAIGAEAEIRGFDRHLFGGFTDFSSIADPIAARIWPDGQGFARGDERFVVCHMALSTLRRAFPDGQFITILRDPVARVVSHWLFWRTVPQTQLESWGAPWSARLNIARRPLADFLTSPEIAAQTDNLQLRTLLWPHPLIPDDGFVERASDAELLLLAVERLEQLDFVGVLEEESLETDLSLWLGHDVEMPFKNTQRPLPDELRATLVQELSDASPLLAARSRLDAALWRAALSADTNADELRITSSFRYLARVIAGRH